MDGLAEVQQTLTVFILEDIQKRNAHHSGSVDGQARNNCGGLRQETTANIGEQDTQNNQAEDDHSALLAFSHFSAQIAGTGFRIIVDKLAHIRSNNKTEY